MGRLCNSIKIVYLLNGRFRTYHLLFVLSFQKTQVTQDRVLSDPFQCAVSDADVKKKKRKKQKSCKNMRVPLLGDYEL